MLVRYADESRIDHGRDVEESCVGLGRFSLFAWVPFTRSDPRPLAL